MMGHFKYVVSLFLPIRLHFVLLLAGGLVCSCLGFSQTRQIDSLLTKLKTQKGDTNALRTLNFLFLEYEFLDSAKAKYYIDESLVLAKKLDVKSRLAQTYMLMGYFYNDIGNNTEAMKYFRSSLDVRQKMGDKNGIADSYTCIAIIYDNMGNYPDALKMNYAALKLYEEIGDKDDIANCYNNIGVIYDNQENFTEALKNHLISLKWEQKKGDKIGIAKSYTNLGIVCEKKKEYAEALKYYVASLKITEELNEKQSSAHNYNNMGVVYDDLGKYDEALKSHLSALHLREEIGDKNGITSSYCNIGNVLTKQKKYKEAKEYLIKGKDLSIEIGAKENIKFSYKFLTNVEDSLGNYKSAFENHKMYILYRDSLDNEQTKRKSIQSSMQYEFDKKEIAAKAEQEKLNAISAEEKQKQRIIIYAVAGVLALVFVFTMFLLNRFRITRRQKLIIEQQKEKVDEAYERLHEKNKEVMDSIFYARRIQTALLPNENYINKSLTRLMKN